jgi:SPP1 family predicted phage head-tail adaptor
VSLEAGRLRHRIRIEQLQNLPDSHGDDYQDPETGETRQEWVEVATVWAAIEPLSAREFIAAQATQSQITARIVIRYRDGMDGSMRLVHVRTGRADTVYNPHGFQADVESGLEYLTAPCSTGVSTSGQ